MFKKETTEFLKIQNEEKQIIIELPRKEDETD